jgi:ATP-dependent exoDNAse (exonuclease V) beta subunit
VRRLSFTALSTFEQCAYKYYVRYLIGMKEQPVPETGEDGPSATEIGSAVHELLEQVDLGAPAVPDIEDERVRELMAAYCGSELARRLAGLARVEKERPFTFEHDGVLVHGFLDVFHLESGRALVVDYKTNLLDEEPPETIVEQDYRLQRLVYALACFRAGADEVEVVYQFLERPDAVVTTTFTRDQLSELEEELSAAIAQIQVGEYRPTPSEFACAGCPALDLVCAGLRLREPAALTVSAA